MKIELKCEPVWAQADVIKVLYGLPKPTLIRLACEGKVRSRKLEDVQENCAERTTRVFRCSDVAEWIEKEAINPNQVAMPCAVESQVAV